MSNGWIPASEAAREFGLDLSTIPHAIRQGRLKGKKMGRMWLVRSEDVAKLTRGPYRKKDKGTE